MKIYSRILASLFIFSSLTAQAADVPVPVATDSRIKTFVYSENDVFNLVAHYGYQSNIEFPANEQIETISVGNRMGWQIVTAGRRMFIRPTLANARTNMTVITSKHAYQFDLTAVPAVYNPNEELAYVIRFYYPDEKKGVQAQAPYYGDMPETQAMPIAAPVPPVAPVATVASVAPAAASANYSYSYTGDAAIAPAEVYDNGASTYFKFAPGVDFPKIAALDANKKELPLSARREGEFWVVDSVSPQFMVRQGSAVACIFNDRYAQN